MESRDKRKKVNDVKDSQTKEEFGEFCTDLNLLLSNLNNLLILMRDLRSGGA